MKRLDEVTTAAKMWTHNRNGKNKEKKKQFGVGRQAPREIES